MRDNRGTELQVGDRVAYNISGEIAEGVIVELTPPVIDEEHARKGYSWERRLKQALIKIHLVHDAAGKSAGHVSKVRHEHNVLVIMRGGKYL